MLTSDSLSDLEGAAPRLLQHLQEKRWAVNSTKVQRPGLSVKFLGVIWLGSYRQSSGLSYPHNCSIATGVSGSSRLLGSVYPTLGTNSQALILVGTKGRQVGLGWTCVSAFTTAKGAVKAV